jgi:phosphoribosylanthranilate isomerase
MKNLRLVSFVGVDKNTNLSDLLKFKQSSIFYEFGVLYSDSKNEIQKRYPGHEFTLKFLRWARENKVNSSLHLCGASIERYLKEDSNIIDICSMADRIQLNINMNKFDDTEKLANDIIEVSSKHNNSIILQKNKSKAKFNEKFISKLDKEFSLSLLNDSSGGFGREIHSVSSPHDKYFTGYAGGINPDNVINILDLIENTCEGMYYYIDMESGIRINNDFSIVECDKIRKLIDSWLEVK